DEPPTRESNPALRLRRPPCVRYTRGETAECPCQESSLVFELRGAACRPTRQGRHQSRRPDSNRHEPAYKTGASPFGHVDWSRDTRIGTREWTGRGVEPRFPGCKPGVFP